MEEEEGVPVFLEEFLRLQRETLVQVIELRREVRKLSNTQADIDAQVTAINAAVTGLQTAEAAIKAEVDALKAGGADTTKLDAAVASLSSEVGNVAGLAPAPTPAPGPTPPPPTS